MLRICCLQTFYNYENILQMSNAAFSPECAFDLRSMQCFLSQISDVVILRYFSSEVFSHMRLCFLSSLIFSLPHFQQVLGLRQAVAPGVNKFEIENPQETKCVPYGDRTGEYWSEKGPGNGSESHGPVKWIV